MRLPPAIKGAPCIRCRTVNEHPSAPGSNPTAYLPSGYEMFPDSSTGNACPRTALFGAFASVTTSSIRRRTPLTGRDLPGYSTPQSSVAGSCPGGSRIASAGIEQAASMMTVDSAESDPSLAPTVPSPLLTRSLSSRG